MRYQNGTHINLINKDYIMAQVKGGIGSFLSGKLDGVVYVQLNGTTHTRQAPTRTKDSWTPKMLLNQQRFGLVNAFCKQFKSTVIPQIWNIAAEKMSGYALFMKSNMSAFAKDGSLAYPKKIKFSTGKLLFPEEFKVQRQEADSNTINVSWKYDVHLGGLRLKDELMVVLGTVDGKYSEIKATGILRGKLNGSFELPEAFKEASYIYVFFNSQDQRDYSESACFEI